MHCDIRTRLYPLFNTTAQVQGCNLTHAQWDTSSTYTTYAYSGCDATCFN